MVDEDIERMAKTLRAILEGQSISISEVERRVGWSRGTLTKLLQGNRELKIRQLLSILEAIQVDPLYFFHRVYGMSEAGRSVERTVQHLDTNPGAYRPLMLPRLVDETELRRLIQEAVEQAVRSTTTSQGS